MTENLKRVPMVTVKRLSRYLRVLERFHDDGHKTISSGELSSELHVKPSQLRKDLAYFGEFGTRGMGYHIPTLLDALRKILGLNRQWAIAIVGVGNLGTALLRYKGLNERGFRVAALFDDDPEKVGSSRSGVHIFHIDELAEIVREKNIQIAIITVPAPAARPIAEIIFNAGITAVLNFAPVSIQHQDNVTCLPVDIASELKILSHHLAGLEQENGAEFDTFSGDE